MNWLSYLFPQTTVRASTLYNRDIRVVVDNGKKKLLVNGIQQSGPMIEGFWNFAFSHLPMPAVTTVHSILVLGVGGGTVIHKLHTRYPDANITGVDIDEQIISIGRNQFGLSDIKKLNLVVSDAVIYVRTNRKKYDFIIVDLYIGRDIPDFESSAPFVSLLRANLQKHGSLVFNFLHDGESEKRSKILNSLLKQLFTRVVYADLTYNRFFFAQ